MHRIRFAHQLRALAVLSVVFSHLVGVFWLVPGMVADASATPMLDRPIPSFVHLVTVRWWQPGPFGVALFFLVSGFVIPLSLRGRTPGAFLAARAVRLWPTFAVATACDLLIAWWNSRTLGHSFTPGVWPVIANLLLVPTYAGVISVDLVNWTLGVEFRFYLLAALLARIAGGVTPRAALGAITACAIAALAWPASGGSWNGAAARAGGTELADLGFMLLGSLFAAHHAGALSALPLAGSLAAGLLLDAACWRSGPLAPEVPVVFASYVEALGVFALLYLWRDRIGPHRWLDRLADISYPVYLLHTIIGFTVLKRLMLAGHWSFGSALPVALCVVLGGATVLHVAIEAPTMRLAHRLGRARR